jgi:hypothetical protein
VCEVSVHRAVGDAPYFLISYSHSEYNGWGNEAGPDNWMIKFYADLCRNVEELAAPAVGQITARRKLRLSRGFGIRWKRRSYLKRRSSSGSSSALA